MTGLLYRHLRLVIAVILIPAVFAALLQLVPLECPDTLTAMFNSERCSQRAQVGVILLGVASGCIGFLAGMGIEILVYKRRGKPNSDST